MQPNTNSNFEKQSETQSRRNMENGVDTLKDAETKHTFSNFDNWSNQVRVSFLWKFWKENFIELTLFLQGFVYSVTFDKGPDGAHFVCEHW